MATFIVWTWPALLVAVVLLGRAWLKERQAARASAERADLETRRAIGAALDLRQEQAQLLALEQRRQHEVARLTWLLLAAWRADGTHLPSYRQGLIDAYESAAYTRPEAEQRRAA